MVKLSMTYEEQLLTPEWAVKREEIMRRDWYMCTRCMSTKQLQVHHKRYQPGKMAWEYEGWFALDLVTLCRKCHCAEHGVPYEEKPAFNHIPDFWDECRRKDDRSRGTGFRHIRDVIIELCNG